MIYENVYVKQNEVNLVSLFLMCGKRYFSLHYFNSIKENMTDNLLINKKELTRLLMSVLQFTLIELSSQS